VSRRELETRERNLEVAEADLRIAEKNRGATTLLAPFDGRVSRKHVERFQNVQPRQPIFLLQDTTRLEITVSLPEADLVRLERVMDLGALSRRLNPVVAVSSLPTDASFPARLTEIATAADPTTRTFEARLAFEAPPDLLLLPGMTAQVRIGAGLAERGSGFPIPARAAVIDANRAASVWKVDPKTMEVHKVAVELGAMAGDSVAVTRGLQRGDVIAVTGASQLRDGMRVRPLETR
jgi:RND family efflux transporter MFP subunit